MAMLIFPGAWYWIIGEDDSRVYSSAHARFVPADEAVYQAWLAQGNRPTRIDTAESLSQVLAKVWPQGMGPELPPIVPDEVTRFQVRAALMMRPGTAPGPTLLDDVGAALAAMPGIEGMLAREAWGSATTVARNSATVRALAAHFGWDDTALDRLFIDAGRISL